jgi:hypothetical protein
MNNSLYDTNLGVIEIPDTLRDHLRICFSQCNGANENIEGFKRNQELQSQKKINYKQLKRIKNFFDNYEGTQEEFPWILNGGGVMKGWVENSLNLMRDNAKKHMDTRPEDPKLSHSDLKNDISSLQRPSQQHKKTSEKHATSVFESEIVSSLKRINEIISKI